MILSELSGGEFTRRLHAGELALRCGPFVVRVASPIRHVAEGLRLLYSDFELAEGFADFRLDLVPGGGIRRWFRPQVQFTSDIRAPFAPFPLDQAYPLFEWSLNWCIASTTLDHLIIHAAVVERNGAALILPGEPGAGKSTLTAALVNRGWRLLSDELTLIDPADRRIVPLPRPVSLKNRSIDVIRGFAPAAVFNKATHNTAKGTIAHMKPASADVRRAAETATVRWVVFLHYEEHAAPVLAPRSKPDTVLDLAKNSFNYLMYGLSGFELLCDVVEGSACFHFEYGELDDAIATFERLSRGHVP